MSSTKILGLMLANFKRCALLGPKCTMDLGTTKDLGRVRCGGYGGTVSTIQGTCAICTVRK